MPRAASTASREPSRGRVSFELAGCFRELQLALPGKLASIATTRSEGFEVDVFCALEACSATELVAARAGLVDDFVGHIRRALSLDMNLSSSSGSRSTRAPLPPLVQCEWWPHSNGVLDATGRLKREHVAAQQPGYPYPHHHPLMRVDHTIAQAHKLESVARLRRRSGRAYALVWRSRPDYVSTGVSVSAAHALLAAGRAGGSDSALDYLVPSSCTSGAHTDIEALLSERAADHYSAQRHALPALYREAGEYFAAPEVVLGLHLRRGHLRYRVLPTWRLYRCSTPCFGEAQPCRQLLPATQPVGGRPCEGACLAVTTNGTCGDLEAAAPPHYVEFLHRLCRNNSTVSCRAATKADPKVLARAFGRR